MTKESSTGELGSSLTELVVVLAVIAVFAVIAGPSYKKMLARSQARSAATEIAGELRLARQLAMARRERLRVRFDRERQTITLERADAGDVLDVYRYAEKGIVLDEPTAGLEVLFHPSGRSATATTLTILDAEGKRTMLTISLTGRVTIS